MTANAQVFNADPFIGCPFDSSDMQLVETHGRHSVGGPAKFEGLNDIGTRNHPVLEGEILAIGENAKYLDGQPFTAFAIKVDDRVYFKTESDLLL